MSSTQTLKEHASGTPAAQAATDGVSNVESASR
jgi:hypothetical protein